jgi:hypothetical protein
VSPVSSVSVKETITLATGFSRAKILSKSLHGFY